MISQANSSALRASYPTKAGEAKEPKQAASVTKQGDTSKIEQLKESIGSGEYKVNIEALSQKIADELL